MTKTALAGRVRLSVRSVSGYESGAFTPSDETLAALSRVLGFPIAFFGKPETRMLAAERVNFRALSTMAARERDRALAAATIGTDLWEWIEDRFDLPSADFLAFQGVPSEPEALADWVRAAWDIESATISNLLHLMELKGVRVLSLIEQCRQLDAFSFVKDGRPFVFLNTVKSAERGRFDAAHELGHLLMHSHARSTSDARRREHEADIFASAFLMPRESILSVGHSARLGSLDELVHLKERWGVSVAALVKRLHDVGVLSDWQYRTHFIELSRRGYRTEEPLTRDRESSQVLQKVLESMGGEGVAPSQIASDLAIPLSDLEEYLFGLATTSTVKGLLRLVHN